MGIEPTTFCMASRRSSQLSYIRKISNCEQMRLRLPPLTFIFATTAHTLCQLHILLSVTLYVISDYFIQCLIYSFNDSLRSQTLVDTYRTFLHLVSVSAYTIHITKRTTYSLRCFHLLIKTNCGERWNRTKYSFPYEATQRVVPVTIEVHSPKKFFLFSLRLGGGVRSHDLQVMGLVSYHCSTPQYILVSQERLELSKKSHSANVVRLPILLHPYNFSCGPSRIRTDLIERSDSTMSTPSKP